MSKIRFVPDQVAVSAVEDSAMMQRQKIYHKVRIQQFHLLDHGDHQLHLDHKYQRQSLWHHFLYELVQVMCVVRDGVVPNFLFLVFFLTFFCSMQLVLH